MLMILPVVDVLVGVDLELITALAGSHREGHVDTSKDIVGVGLSVEQSLALVITLVGFKVIITNKKMYICLFRL
jgi:hypothetical protein